MKIPHISEHIIMKAAVEVAKQLGVDEGEYDIVKYYIPQMDGYELAKELETYANWTININDVKTLDQMGTFIDFFVRWG